MRYVLLFLLGLVQVASAASVTIVNDTTCPLGNLYYAGSNGVSLRWTAGTSWLYGPSAAWDGLAPGGSVTVSLSGTEGYQVRVEYDAYPGGAGASIVGGPYDGGSGSWATAVHITGLAGGCGVVSNWYCSKISMKNTDSIYAAFAYFIDGNMVSWKWLSPGESWTEEKCDSVKHTLKFRALSYASGEPVYVGDYFGSQADATNASVGGYSTTNIFTPLENQYSGGTSNISWGTNSPNIGDSAIYDAIVKFAAQNHLDLGALVRTNPINVSVSNSTSVSVTNSTDLSGLTNLLTQIRNNATNLAPYEQQTNLTMGSLQGGATNFDYGQGIMEGLLDSSGLEGKVADFQAKFEMPSLPAPVLDDWSMEFCGQTINLNPVFHFGSVANACLTGLTCVAWLGFGLFASRLFFQTVQTFGYAQLGGVPDLEVEAATFGSNILGVLVAMIVPAIFVGAWVLILYGIMVWFTDLISAAIGWNAFVGSLGTKAWYLLTSFVPVELVIRLAMLSVTLTVSVGKITLIGLGAGRFLFGK